MRNKVTLEIELVYSPNNFQASTIQAFVGEKRCGKDISTTNNKATLVLT